jgi:hypothetical protein
MHCGGTSHIFCTEKVSNGVPGTWTARVCGRGAQCASKYSYRSNLSAMLELSETTQAAWPDLLLAHAAKCAEHMIKPSLHGGRLFDEKWMLGSELA